jgi:hypothetical protein
VTENKGFFGGSYHPIPLLENNQYGRIRWLRLIVYYHNLHLWYRVVYIGGIQVLLKVLSRWHKRNIWFHHFKKNSFPSDDMAFFWQILNGKFHFKIQKWKFSNFRGIFQFFFISLWYGQIFSNFNSNVKIDFFQNFPFPSGGIANFFPKFKNKNLQFKFQKWNIKKNVSNFPYGTRFVLSIPDRNRHVPDRNISFSISRNIEFVFRVALPLSYPFSNTRPGMVRAFSWPFPIVYIPKSFGVVGPFHGSAQECSVQIVEEYGAKIVEAQ